MADLLKTRLLTISLRSPIWLETEAAAWKPVLTNFGSCRRDTQTHWTAGYGDHERLRKRPPPRRKASLAGAASGPPQFFPTLRASASQRHHRTAEPRRAKPTHGSGYGAILSMSAMSPAAAQISQASGFSCRDHTSASDSSEASRRTGRAMMQDSGEAWKTPAARCEATASR